MSQKNHIQFKKKKGGTPKPRKSKEKKIKRRGNVAQKKKGNVTAKGRRKNK